MIGGAPVTQDYADRIGADGYQQATPAAPWPWPASSWPPSRSDEGHSHSAGSPADRFAGTRSYIHPVPKSEAWCAGPEADLLHFEDVRCIGDQP